MTSPLKRTPLYSLHQQHGAKIVPFAGYEMPLNYPSGIRAEHLHTRKSAGLFDVSHMGQINVRSDAMSKIATTLESLIPVDILSLPPGRQKYGMFTNPQGGIIDDLMIQNLGDHFVLVVNAACKQQDFEHINKHLGTALQLELVQESALLALQGPASASVLENLGCELGDMKFMDVRQFDIDGIACTISRSGYSGEDGFEISLAAEFAERLATRLLADAAVQPIGLGARDSLRLEAGLCLYGHDITTTTTPIEAGLNWAISPARRFAGVRAGGFLGADIILPQMPKNVARRRVGMQPHGRAPVREGATVLNTRLQPIGAITSGGYSPSLERPICIGYVELEYAASGTEVNALVRGKNLPMTVIKLPFISPNFYR